MLAFELNFFLNGYVLLTAEGFRQRPDPTSHHFGGGFNSRPASQQSKYSKMGGGGGGTSSHLSFHSKQHHRSRHIQGLPTLSANGLGGINGAGFSVYPQRDEIMLNEKYFPRDEYFLHHQTGDDHDINADHDPSNNSPMMKHPHLQVRGLTCEKSARNGNRVQLLDDISLEARAGEIVGILATSEREGTALLDILADSPSRDLPGFKVRGDLVVNGVTTTSSGLGDRLAYVQQNIRWCPDMTTRQTLLFTALLQAPGRPARNFDTKGRVS